MHATSQLASLSQASSVIYLGSKLSQFEYDISSGQTQSTPPTAFQETVQLSPYVSQQYAQTHVTL